MIRDLIQEARVAAIPIKAKVMNHERILWRGLIGHMTEGKIKITLRPQKRSGGTSFASVRLNEMVRGRYDIRFHRFDAYAPLTTMGYIAHEMTHVKQYIRGHLGLEDRQILWHGKPYMDAAEYAAITNYSVYKKLPWEAEAIHVAKTLPRQWLRSAIPSLKGKDPILDYLIKHDTFL